MLQRINANLVIPIWSLIFGLSICLSTAAMSTSYAVLSIAVLFLPDFVNKFRDAFKEPFVKAAVVFYGVFVLATVWGTASMHDEYRMLIRMIGYCLVPFLLLAFQTRNAAQMFVFGYVLGGVISLVISLYSYFKGTYMFYGIRDQQFVAYHGHIIQSAFLSIIACVFLLMLFRPQVNSVMRVIYAILYLLCAYDIMFVVIGRTGQFMLILVSATVFIYRFRLKGMLIFMLIAAISSPFIYYSKSVQTGIEWYKRDMQELQAGNPHTSMGARKMFHEVSIQLIKQKPILGYGTGGYAGAYKQYATSHGIEAEGVNPHRDIYWVYIDTGILGVLAFLWMIVALLLNLRETSYLYRGMGYVLVAGYLLASTQNSFFIDNITGMGFISLATALVASYKTQQENY